jgi:hypothetical protein
MSPANSVTWQVFDAQGNGVAGGTAMSAMRRRQHASQYLQDDR